MCLRSEGGRGALVLCLAGACGVVDKVGGGTLGNFASSTVGISSIAVDDGEGKGRGEVEDFDGGDNGRAARDSSTARGGSSGGTSSICGGGGSNGKHGGGALGIRDCRADGSCTAAGAIGSESSESIGSNMLDTLGETSGNGENEEVEGEGGSDESMGTCDDGCSFGTSSAGPRNVGGVGGISVGGTGSGGEGDSIIT